MAMTADITPNTDFLLVGVSGEFSLHEADCLLTRVFEVLAQHAVRKVLVDIRQVKGDPQVFERYFHARHLANELHRFSGAGVSPLTRFAYLGAEPLIEKRRLGELVAVNRGVAAKVTETMEEAARWLDLKPEKRSFAPKKG